MEIEFKLQIPAGADAAIDAALRAQGAHPLRLQARYFDTPDGRLRAAGIALRLRREGENWKQTLKTAGASTLARQEHEVDRGPDGPGAPDLPDLALHAGTPAGEALADALGADGAATLAETFGTDIERLLLRLPAHGGQVELALDRGEVHAVRDGRRHAETVSELELELLEGPVSALAALARDWCSAHGLWLGTVTKSQRGQRQAGLPWTRRPPAAPRLDGKPSAATVQRRLVDHCLALALPAADTVASGIDDAEAVHRLRTALRRLRTVLRELDGLGTPPDPAWEPAIATAFRALGAWRDHQQLQDRTLPALQALGGPALQLPGWTGTTPRDVVRDTGLQCALIDLLALAAGEGGDDPGDGPRPRRFVRERLRKLHHRLARDAQDFSTLDAEARHKVRKRLKRLRYLLELTAGLFPNGATDALVDRLKPAQDALGQANDDAVALEALRALAAEQPAAWFGVGVLTARGEGETQATAKALRKLARASLP